MNQIMLIVALMVIHISFAGETPVPINPTPDRDYDVHHIRIDIAVNMEKKSVSGKVTHSLSPLKGNLEEILLDAEDLEIQSVRIGDETNLDFEIQEKYLSIHLDRSYGWEDTMEITIDYSAIPRRGLYFILPDSTYPEKHTQAWTQGEDTDNHYWVPLYDYPNDKATTETILTVEKPYTAISNGELVSISENSDGTRTYHWREGFSHSSYLISFAIGDYVKVEDDYQGLPVNYWVYPEVEINALRSFGKTPDMIRFFNEKTGFPYPYEKYDQVIVEDFMFGGMENITLTHNTDRTIHDSRATPDHSSDGLVAHELAHQWYGDLLTTRNWANIWLNEGFATYFAMLYRAEDLGSDEGEYIRLGQINGYLATDSYKRRPTVEFQYVESMDLFNSNVYAKGSLILNMLKQILGEDAFWRSIQSYTRDNAFKNVETTDLIKSIEEVTGQNLDWFFEQWVYRGGVPEYNVDWNYIRRTGTVVVNVQQIQDLETTSMFKMPVVIVLDNGKISRHSFWIDGPQATISIPSSTKPKMVLFDEGNQIPKKLTFKKSISELKYQLENAPHILDRISAAKDLGKGPLRRKAQKALESAIISDPFWGVRLAAVDAYVDLKPKNGAETLITMSTGQDNRVRRACIRGLRIYEDDQDAGLFLEGIIKNDSSYYAVADAIGALVKVDSTAANDLLELALNMNSHQDVIRKAALRAMGKIHTEENFNRLFSAAEYGGTTWEARSTAVSSLRSYADSHSEVLEQAIVFLEDPNYGVRRSAVDLVGQFGNKSHFTALDDLVQLDPMQSRNVQRAKERILKKDKDGDKEALIKENRQLKELLDDIRKILEQN